MYETVGNAYAHPKMAPRAEDGADDEVTIYRRQGVGVVSPGFRIAADRDWLRLFIYFLSTLRAAGRTRC